MRTPEFRNDSSRRRFASQSYENVVFVKIVLLGLKRTVVPRSVVEPTTLERSLRLAHPVLLAVQLAVARDSERQRARERVHDRNADAVQAARDLVGVVVEFSASVQHGHDDLGCRTPFFAVDIGRNAPAIVLDGDRFVGVNRHDDAVAVPRQGLVDRVIHDLENHVVEAGPVVGVADVHAGPFADGLEAF